MDFKEIRSVKDIETYKFSALNTSFSAIPENECFCINKTKLLDGQYGCVDGLLDLSACAGK